jgi:hypothetical protein
MANTPAVVKDNLERVRMVLRNLPWYLRMLNDKKDTNNKESLESSATGNRIEVRNPPGNEQQAMNKGRGSTEETQWIDEVPHINYVKTVILNSAPSWGRAKEFAKANGVPYARIFSSTPGVLGTPSGDYVFDTILPQCVRFDEKLFYDQPNVQSLQELIKDQSRNDFVYVRFTYKQLGFGEDYLAQQYRDLQNDSEAIEREVLLKWARRSNDSPFTVEQLNRVYKHLKDPIGTVTVRGTYSLKFFEKPDTKKKYAISVDCSGMLDNDYSSLVITDPQTFAVVATLRSNARTEYSNTTSFTYAIADILRMFPESLLIIEKNNMGIAIIDSVMTLAPDLVDRLYSSDLEPAQKASNYGVGYTDENINLRHDYKRTMVYGFDTNNARRTQMFSEVLGIVINELYDVIRDNDLFIELNNIIRNKKGRLDHRQGQHDDLLFAYLIGLWVLCYSKILNEKYDYPFGYIRPMSLVDDGIKRIEEPNTEEPTEDIADTAVKLYGNDPERDNPYRSMLVWEKPNLDTRESRVPVDTTSNNMSYAEISDLIFGNDESIIDLGETNIDSEVEFDPEVAEDMQETMRNMNTTDRDAYHRKHFENFDKTVITAKMTKQEAMLKARNVRNQQILKEKLASSMPENVSDTTIDELIDTFFNK